MAQKQPQEPAITLITNLAPEILRNIFGHFCSHCSGDYQWPFRTGPQAAQDNTSLFNLCLVSRYFRGTAQEILHHSFNLDCHEWPSDHSKRRLEPFLATVASRPDLARSVAAVFIQGPLIEHLDFEEARRAFGICARSLGTNPRDIYQKVQASEELSSTRMPSRATILGQSPAIKRAFFLGEPTPEDMKHTEFIFAAASKLLTMVVSILPNLVHLGMEEGRAKPHRRQEIDVEPDTLDALGITSIGLTTFESDRALDNLLWRAPNLETLVTLGLFPFPELPSVRNLHIRTGGRLHGWWINECLSPCTGPLSTFSFTGVDPEISSVIECIDQPRLHGSLESLHLFKCRRAHYTKLRPVPSLKRFTKLKTLSIPTAHIYGPDLASPHHVSLVNILPANITSLTLVRHDEPTPLDRMMEDLQCLFNAKHALFTQLKEIRIRMEHIFDEHLTTLSEPIGVDLIHQELLGSRWICSGHMSRYAQICLQ
ncbi:hypothetical protein FSARC_3657 [Fusarium sarcochroum]|uniref:F-box domain-containing protein n=1 Tax=Fusarium sarcochroum TaxID=1208366 RepID=A0A8H4XBG5_9HYPO|nr:hypothetical protein FSARC_3657 [Fusarium sarcochroum]